ncbi:hypothetical protein CVD28_14050 [Bacillus sp. M6-12]|uniref:beta-propeller domain-containing protein n=1 Tax=Bacillus sp. M6-12 TaxID=2054166 RepID=UPI000C7750AB|nr:beta-propeller domain-containing protein [Bacillus sp. M6-12]PLS17171.1 hypothetical protein CVD28_14050 [Bacillus sp. M6-12]
MRKKYFIVGGIVLCLLGVFMFVFLSGKPKLVNEFNAKAPYQVLTNHAWKVMFTEKINKTSLKDNYFYVTDEKGNRQNSRLSFDDDQKTVVISPPEKGYKINSSGYVLHISRDIKSTAGRRLGSKKEIAFTVQESLPVIGSKQRLNDHFRTILKREKKRQSFWTMNSAEESKKSDSSAGGSKESADVSETNVQVAGIDEGDSVKTDGKYIYHLSDGKIRIIKEASGTMEKAGEIRYDDTFYPQALYLHDQQLIVIGSESGDWNFQKRHDKENMISRPFYEFTKTIVYEMKNPKKPKKIREVKQEGHMISSRKSNGIIYIASIFYPEYMLLDQGDADLRPMYADSADSPKMKIIDYDKISYFPQSQERGFSILSAFDLAKPLKKAEITTQLGSGEQFYMSSKNIYLAVSDNSISEEEKDFVWNPDTIIYKFSINGTKIDFQQSAGVKGTLLNQFSMDEHEGYFRIATTKGDTFDNRTPSSNNIYILDQNMKMAGHLENLARGEKIYSARFMGDKIYVVTFKQVDPLFVIDAADPKVPKILGKLKIPGFSDYLHPLDENHLIGFGHHTKLVSQKGSREPLIRTDGVKLAIFDVTDVTNPKEKFSEIIGDNGTSSPLNYDHKALLFNKETGLFAFPVNIYNDVKNSGYEETKLAFQGALAFTVDKNKGFTLNERITHVEAGNMPLYEEWESVIDRLIYIGDTMYALSPSKITSHSLTDHKKTGELLLQ